MALYHKLEFSEILLVKLFETQIDSNDLVLFDIGTNRGLFIDLFLEIKADKKIYAFEPIPSLFERLTKRYMDDSIILNNFAISAVDGEEDFCELTDAVTDGCSSLVERGVFNERHWNYKKYKVKTQTLDSFCEENGIDYVDFIKIDVEGAEVDVLKGASKLISENRIGLIQFEYGITTFNDANVTLLEIYEQVTASNYNLFDFQNGKLIEMNLDNINHYASSQGTNYVIKNNNLTL